MGRRERINHCKLAFINGVNDAVSVIMLHQVFVVLMTGNLIYSITGTISGFEFSDVVRISLMITFVLSNIIVHKLVAYKSVLFKTTLSIGLLIIYLIIGVILDNHQLIGIDSWGFLLVANIATIMSISINNIFYRIHATKFNLVAYTMNLMNLSYMLSGGKKTNDMQSLFEVFISFILGLLIASFLTVKIHFFSILIYSTNIAKYVL